MKTSRSLFVASSLFVLSYNLLTYNAQKPTRIFPLRVFVQPVGQRPTASAHTIGNQHSKYTHQNLSFSDVERFMNTRGDLVALGLIGFLTANLTSYLIIHYAIG